MKTSVVVTTYNRPADLVDCLRSLRGQFEQPDEIIVVDDGDIERTASRLRDAELHETVTHVEGPGKSLPAARNAAVAETSGDVVCFIDDDVVVPPTWLREIVSTYERADEIMGVGGYVLNYNPEAINKANVDSAGYRALTGVRLLFLLGKIGHISPVGILWAPHVFMTSGTQEVDVLQGCNMTFRSEVFDQYRFDEWYGTEGSSACEELDFCGRLSADGNRLLYNPRAPVLHKRSVSDDSRTGDPNYDNISNLTYSLLRNPKLGLHNYLLFVCAILVYSIFNLDSGYLRGVGRGTTAYWHSGDRDTDEVTERDS